MASTTITVHAPDNTNVINFIYIELTGILCPPVTVTNAASLPMVQNIGIIKGDTQNGVFILVSIANPKTFASKQSKITKT